MGSCYRFRLGAGDRFVVGVLFRDQHTDLFDAHQVRRYVNAPGNICGNADTSAF